MACEKWGIVDISNELLIEDEIGIKFWMKLTK